MSTVFTPEIVQSLSAQIDEQVSALGSFQIKSGELSVQRSLEPTAGSSLAVQAAEIERITQEKPMRFLRKFRKAAKQDICEEGGVLNAQWQRWKDLASEDVVKSFGPYLVAMGFVGGPLESLVVALGVVVIHIGLKAFCEEFEEDMTGEPSGETGA